MEIVVSVAVGFAILLLVLMGAAFAPPKPRRDRLAARSPGLPASLPASLPAGRPTVGTVPPRVQIDQARRAADRLSADLLGNAIRH